MHVYKLNMEFLDIILWTRGQQVNGFSDLMIIIKSLIQFMVLTRMCKAPQPIGIQPMGT